MKRFLIALTILFLSVSIISAQEPERTSDLVDMEVEVGTQSPFTKAIPVTVRFRSTVNADKVEISWSAPSTLKISEKHPQFISVQEGEVYTARALFKPTKAGSYEIASNLTVWEFNTNYTFTESVDVTFGDDLVTSPVSVGYSGALIVYYLVITLIVILGSVSAYFGAKYLYKQLREWLRPPE
jgi:uncharacterized membrane-anchored protein